MKNSSRPIIGITLDSVTPPLNSRSEYSQYPWYALRDNYCAAVSNSGGLPILLPHEENLIENYMEIIDGLLIPGGGYDIDPRLYGDIIQHPTVSTNPQRTNFEWALLKKALIQDLPILGICGGHQLINVALGGTLIQHIPDAIKNVLPHKKPHHELAHPISIVPKTRLAHILEGTSTIEVNSFHHQAIKDLGKNLILSAQAPDGIIEGIESLDHSFVLGIQWHPEFMLSSADLKIFEAFIQATQQKISLR